MKSRIESLAQHGVVSDLRDTDIPPNAWTDISNGTLRDGTIQKGPGAVMRSDDLVIRPEWLVPYLDPNTSTFFWIYPGIDDDGTSHIATWDGSTHVVRTRDAEIVNDTPTSPGYSRATGVGWTGGVLNGLVYINSGADVPQKWDRTAGVLNADFEDFDNWPSGYTARVMRTYKNFIMAYDVNDGTTGRDPYRIMWSNEAADAFTEPDTWTPAPGNRAGATQISDQGGYLVDSLPMRGSNLIYRQNQVLIQRFIGGNEVFSFDTLFDDFGLIGQRCVKQFGSGQHFVVSLGDILVHDGNTRKSVAVNRVRKRIFEVEMDSTNYNQAFVSPNYSRKEMWFCYPTSGLVIPNRAAVWNWETDVWSFHWLENVAHIGFGYIPDPSGPVWNDLETYWNDMEGTWNIANINPLVSSMLACYKDTTIDGSEFHQLDSGWLTAGGDPYTSMFERIGIGTLPLVGGGFVYEEQDKDIREVWVRARGAPFMVSVGGSNTPEGPYSWTPPKQFDPSTDRKVDVSGVNHKYVGVRFTESSSSPWYISSYAFEVYPSGWRA